MGCDYSMQLRIDRVTSVSANFFNSEIIESVNQIATNMADEITGRHIHRRRFLRNEAFKKPVY